MIYATDIASFLACPHTATLHRAESNGQLTKPFFNDPTVEMLQKLGLEHEQRYLRELVEKKGLVVAQIDVKSRWANAVAETIRALHEGVDAVYQATFLDAHGVGGQTSSSAWIHPAFSARGLTKLWRPNLLALPKRPH